LSFVSDGSDIISSGRAFQTQGPVTVKAWLRTVDSQMDGASRQLVLVECIVCLTEQIGSWNEQA